MKTFTTINVYQQMVVIYKPFSHQIWHLDACKSVLTFYNCVMQCGSVSPVCRYVLTIFSGKTLCKYDESSSIVANIVVSLTLE